ncbi:MAG TPA: hypothetical protein DCF45_04890, partial [Gammaproteobacteria bacterium]|nr:hypothetical protein [Gammaproteobacteria bacterium]
YAAARRAGIQLATACLRGGCGACRSTLVSGEVRELQPMSRTHCADPQSGEITHYLLCVVGPQSDLVIETERPWKIQQRAALSARLGDRT